MKFEIESIWEEEGTEEIELPDKLPATVGEKAEDKLDISIKGKQRGNQQNAEVNVSSSDFSEVKMYLARTMLKKYTDKDYDLDDISSESINEIAKYYFNKINFFGQKKGQN